MFEKIEHSPNVIEFKNVYHFSIDYTDNIFDMSILDIEGIDLIEMCSFRYSKITYLAVMTGTVDIENPHVMFGSAKSITFRYAPEDNAIYLRID